MNKQELVKEFVYLYVEYVEALDDWNRTKRQAWDEYKEPTFEGFVRYLMFEYLPDDFDWERDDNE